MSKRINLYVDDDLYTEIAKQAMGEGLTITDYARAALREAVLNGSERNYAPIIRQTVREELNRWLEGERVQKSFSADDFFDRLSISAMGEISDLRQLVNACLWLNATNAETVQKETYTHKARDGKDYAFTRSEWYEAAMEHGTQASLDDALK